MTGVRITGDVEKLRAVSRALKDVGDKEQKRELYKAVQRATKPIKNAIKDSARTSLPHSGGLNEWVAALTIRTKQSYNGRAPGVTITGGANTKTSIKREAIAGPLRKGEKRRSRVTKSRKRGTFGARANLRAINRGRIMHPVWGHGPLVGPQSVTPGFWDRPLTGPIAEQAKKEIRDAMVRAVQQVARKSS